MYYRTSSQSKKGVEERIQKEKLIIKRQQIRHGSYPFDLPDSKSKAFERTQISSQTYHRKPEMKLTIEKAKKFFRHAQRKNKVTSEFIRQHMPAMLRFMQHAITPHIVIKRKVIRKRSRIFLRYNCLRKFIFDPSKLKKRRNAKRIHSQWSKRLVTHLRRYSVVEFIEEESMCAEAPKDVSEQLKEQLELLKSGKRIVPLLEEANITEQRKNSQEAVTEVQIEKTSADIENRIEPITTTVSEQLTTVVPELTSLTAVDIANTELNLSTDAAIKDFVPPKRISTDRAEKPNGNFLDMLISKVKNTTEEVISELPKKNECGEACASAEKSMEPPKQRRKSMGKPATNEAEERENSSSSSDFFGFDDNERILGNCPGMLSTPLVQKRDFNSAFVSETLNAYMRDNSLESSAVVNYPQRRPEDGLVLEKSFPPKLDMPAVPEGLQSLRTVAERRAFLQKTRNTKYCIINNLGTVFRELQKRTKGQRIYRQAIDSILSSNSVPMTRQGWKTSAWLLTEVGNYFFQTIDVDGENFRLYGGKGNHRNKLKIPHLSRMKKVPAICLPGCVDRVTFRSLRPVRTIEKRSKLHDSARKNIYRPCPLSQKIIQQSRDDEISFGGLDIVRMPKVELEVFPQLQKPLPDIAKRYLQLILPYGGISREWAEFSVSTLIERQKMVQATNPQRAFIFTLPYANDRNHVIIRRLYKRSEAFEERFDKSSLSFRRKVDEMHANGEATDSLALECADVLTDMLNSVAISCSENSFIKNDPDNIYQNDGDDEMMVEKSVKKTELNQHQQHPGMSHRKQSRLLMELKRLNATVIDAATTKSEEGGSSCDKECCKLGCVCSSLNEGSVVRKHCGKQRCVLECRCKCPSVMRLETDGRTITTEDAFMLRRQATARLARVEKEFTSTIVLTGNETLLINESQYDKKRRCTKIPKRYGDFVDPDEPDFIDSKPHKRTETPPAQNFPLEPVLVKDIIYNHLKHSSVNLKKLHDVKDLAPWCMIHMVYKCFCKGQALVGSPIVIEKQEELTEGTTIDEALSTKNRALYSFDKQESKSYEDSYASYESELESSEASDASEFGLLKRVDERNNYIERRGRIPDNHQVETYMNAGLNLCRRVIPIPRNIYQRRNKKRVAHVQLYIAENENDKTRLSLHEHVLRSVYFHKNPNIRCPVPVPVPVFKTEEKPKLETMVHHRRSNNNKQQNVEGNMSEKRSFCEVKNKISDEDKLLVKKRRISSSEMNEGSSLLRINNNKDLLKNENHKLESPNCSPFHHQSLNQGIMPSEHITIPKIANIFSLNTGVVETMGTDAAAAVAINIPQQSSEALASEQNISPDAVTSVFNVVIKNMNNLVSKKMQDIDMALRRESKAIPAPNAEILCIIRWNNFLEAYLEGFVYLWEVRTSSMTFIAATIKPLMPLVMNALSVINIQALPKENLPLLGRMLIDRKKNEICDGLAVVMQGQQMYWFVKGFLRPDKTRVCPKPTPHSHPLLTRKINILCRLLISQQVNEHKKRQDPAAEIPTALSVDSPIIVQQGSPIVSSVSSTVAANATPQRFVPPKLKVLPMQRNISDHATTILEQMVAQAYGTVRTNVSFRKLYENEIQEIFPPATMNSDHHWLVLDISNDFSHIFIPELKDLLTLDRVQKVMSYAAVKNRIVKMAFGQKSAFNAYVTPKSKRKLYFGPYKHAITAPKLVLLQSVDGQMMLREVYQARHQVNVKALSTTAFWLIQKDGKMFLDLEDEQAQVVDDENPIIIDSELPSIIEQSGRPDRSSTQVSDSLVRENSLNYNTRKEHDDEEEEEEEEDDDDCVIIEDDKAPQISALTLPSNPPRMTERPSQDRLNYTISLGGQNSSLVIQNESKLSNSSLPENTFTILSSNSQSSSVNSSLQKQQQQQHQLLQQQQQHQQKLQQQQLQQQQLQQQQLQQEQLQQQQLQPPSLLHVNSGESTLSQDNSRLFATPTSSSLKIGNELVHPSDIVFTFPTNEANTNISISAEHFTGVSMESILALQQANLPVKDINASSIGSQPNSIDERLQTNTPNDHLSGVSIGTIIPHTDLNPSASDHLGGFSIGTIIPNETETNSGKPIEQHDSTCTTEPGSTTRTIVNSKESQIEPISKAATKNTNMSSMQWNRNITIKKVPIDADRDALKTNTFARKSYPVQQKKVLPTLSNQRLSLVQTPSALTGIPVSNVQYRPKSIATSVRPSNPQANYQTFISHRPIAPKTVTYSHMSNSALPRPTEAQSLSLSVRTPTTVKTLIRAQQQNNTSSQFNHTMIRPSLNATPRVRMPNQGGTPPNRDAGGMKNTTVISRSPMVSSVKAKVISATASQNARVIKSLITPTTAVLPKHNIAAMRFISGQTQPTETAYPKSLHKVLTASKSTLQSSGITPNDPLKISEGSANNTLSNLTQPNGIRKVYSSEGNCSTPIVNTGSGIKRNSMGIPVVRPVPPGVRLANATTQKLQTESLQSLQNSSKINSTIRYAKEGSHSDPNSQTKGVPIELPKLKKFAIISQSNTTVITPPTAKWLTTSSVQREAIITSTSASKIPADKPSNSDPKSVKLGTIQLLGGKSTPVKTDSTVEKSSSPQKSLNSDTEYGFFHANIEGLPKFVVKRVNENYLIKVPNFNGILKLTGLSTVHNYLNQYTTQKCGKTAEDIVNLKWTFKPQDRSKINIISKSNLPPAKTDNQNQSMQKIAAAKRTPTQGPSSSATSQTKTSPANPVTNLSANDSIVLLDDDE